MSSDHATGEAISGEEPQAISILRESEAIWLRRGQRMAELLLVSKELAHGWAAALGLLGASLIVLALLASPEGPVSR